MITIKEFFSFKSNRFFWINIIVMFVVLVALILGALKWLDVYTRHGEAIVVPNVKNINSNEAELMLKNRELTLIVIDSSYVKNLPAGIILDQNPVAGSKVKKGRIIYVTVNSDKVPTVTVPDIIDNSSLRQAEAKLRAMGFKLTEPQFISGEKDWVYGLSLNGRSIYAGDKIPSESVLTITAGNGSDMVVPDSTYTEDAVQEDEAEIDKSWF